VSRRELLLAAVGVPALLAILAATGSMVPLLGSNLLLIVASAFVILSDRLLPADAPRLASSDHRREGLTRGLATGVGWSLIVLVLFVPGYHVWSTVLNDRTLAPGAGALARVDGEIERTSRHRPADAPPDTAWIGSDGRDLTLYWHPTRQQVLIEAATDGRFAAVDAVPPPTERTPGTLRLNASGGRPIAWRITPRDATWVDVRVTYAGREARLPGIRVGDRAPLASEQRGTAVRLQLDRSWIWMSIAVQLLLVALPEELFFRGYLQRRFARALGESPGSGGWLRLTRSNLAASAVFALSHLVIGWNPMRLAVFVPSLLFGRLAERTGGIAGSVLLHAACNLMVQIAATQYLTLR
jgi:hypothetical protein